MMKIPSVVILFLTLLYFTSFSQRIATRIQPSSLEDTIYISNINKLLDFYFMNGKYDSIQYNIKKYNINNEKEKPNKLNAILFLYYGIYLRDHKIYRNYNKSLQMFNKAIFYGMKEKMYELVERANLYKLSIYFSIFEFNNKLSSQRKAIHQFYKNVNFSNTTNSKIHLYKSYFIILSIYEGYKQDSSFYALFGNKFNSVQLNPQSPNYQAVYFGYYVYKNDFKNAEHCFDKLTKLLHDKVIGDALYTYFINSMFYKSLVYLPLSTKIAKKLESRLTYFYDDVRICEYYRTFTQYYLLQNQVSKAKYYNRLALSITKKNPFIPINLKLDILYNTQNILRKEKKEFEALKLFNQIIPIKEKLNESYTAFNISMLQENANNNFKIQKIQAEINLKEQEAKILAEHNRKDLLILVFVIFLQTLTLSVIGYQINKISKQKKNLQELSKTQNTIFVILGHDLRSPVISTLSSLLTITNNPKLSLDEIKEIITTKIARINTLLLTLDNLLNWAHSQQKSFSVRRKNIYIIDTFNEVLELLETNIELKHIKLTIQIPTDITCFVDLNHFKIIVRNLIQNSIKFTPPHGYIEMSAITRKHFVEISIQDSGIGFNQVPQNSQKGSGLGLMLVESLLTLNHGKLKKLDTDKGALVVITLPSNQFQASS